MATALPSRGRRQVDCARYSLLISVSARGDELAADLMREVYSRRLEDLVELSRQTPDEMRALALEPTETSPDVILEIVVSGSTSAVFQYTTPSTILAELTRIESERTSWP